MVTGIEAAGLALAIFPLLVEGLKSYGKGVGTINDYRKYEKLIGRLMNELDTFKTLFDNTCTTFLQDSVSDKELSILLGDPGGPAWHTQEFCETLEDRVTFKTAKAIMNTAEDIGGILYELREKLMLDQANEVCSR